MDDKRTIKLNGPGQKTITRSALARLAFRNSRRLPAAVNDGGVRKVWVGIGWLEDGKPDGDEVLVVDDRPKLAGRFGILLPESRQVLLFGKGRLWDKRRDAEFHLQHSRGYAPPECELHLAYVAEIRRDFWLAK